MLHIKTISYSTLEFYFTRTFCPLHSRSSFGKPYWPLPYEWYRLPFSYKPLVTSEAIDVKNDDLVDSPYAESVS